MKISSEKQVFNIFEWSKKFNRPLILDGAMGTLIQSKFTDLYTPGIWMNKVLSEHPEFIQNLHLEYINAGADIITTFTFRTSPYALNMCDKALHRSEDLVKIAVNLCKEARKQADDGLKPVFIAGSNSSMVHCYNGSLKDISDEEIYANHFVHIENLMTSGVDFILNETLGNLREIQIICEICHNNKIPYVMSLYCDEKLKLLSGESVPEVVEIIKKYNPLAISFNCVKYSVMKKILEEIDLKKMIWGCYINCGDEEMQEKFVKLKGKIEEMSGILDFAVNPEELKKFSEEIINGRKLRPSFIGSCCCSDKNHTKKLTELVKPKTY